MSPDRAPSRARSRDHDEPTRPDRIPAEPLSAKKSSREPQLLIGLSDQLLYRDEVRFDLFDKNRPRPGMSCQDVDRASFAVDRIRHLDLDLPAQRAKTPYRDRSEGRMALIEESVECTASPSNRGIETGADHGKHPSDGPQRQRFEMACLDGCDRRLTDPRCFANVDLAQASALAQHSQRSADPGIVHGCIVMSRTYPRVTRPPRIVTNRP